jgi:hypothetical protein
MELQAKPFLPLPLLSFAYPKERAIAQRSVGTALIADERGDGDIATTQSLQEGVLETP